MSISYHVGVEFGNAGDTTSTSSAITTTGGTGSALIISLRGNPSLPPFSVTDNKGNTYILIGSKSDTAASGTAWVYGCMGGVGGAGHTVSVQWSSGNTSQNWPTCSFIEYLDSGGAALSVSDLFTGVNSGGSGAGYTVTTGTFSTGVGICHLCVFTDTSGGSPNTYTDTTGTFTVRASQADGSTFWVGADYSAPVTPPTALTGTLTCTFGFIDAAWVGFGLKSGGSGGTSTAAESSAGTTLQDSSVIFTKPAAESSSGTSAQTATAALSVSTAETSAGTTSQDDTVALSTSVSETSASSTSQNATLAVPVSVSESSIGTTSQTATSTLTAGVTESSIGTTAQDAPTGSGTFSTNESSAGTTSQNFTATVSASVSEATLGSTTQNAIVTPPQGSGASGVRRWLIQYYNDYYEKRKKNEAIKELSKEVLQASAGAVTPKMVRERRPSPVVILTPDAASLARKTQQLRDNLRINAQIDALMESQRVLAEMPNLRVDDLHLQIEQGEEEDLLLLASIL